MAILVTGGAGYIGSVTTQLLRARGEQVASGATADRGEHHEPETHLIPLVLKTAQGEVEHVAVFGSDYPTKDGTCVRDYIHVLDLAEAHLLSLQYLRAGNPSTAINLGNGQGYSVLEVIETAREVTGAEIKVRMQERRPGDPSHLVADSSRARSVLGWRPQHAELRTIVGSAWQWHTKHVRGYDQISVSERRTARRATTFRVWLSGDQNDARLSER